MKARYSHRFLEQYSQAPPEVQSAFDKQCKFLLENLRHPSLRAKKYNEKLSLWQARVSRNWRFYFTIEGGEYHLHDIRPHPK